MLALCSVLLVTYHALNYAGIIGLGLIDGTDIYRKCSILTLVPPLITESSDLCIGGNS